MPVVWRTGIFILCLLPILLIHRVSVALQSRTTVEICGRGAICGLMVMMVSGAVYFGEMLLKEYEVKNKIYPVVISLGLVASLGVAVISVLSERFLVENIRTIGWVMFVAGSMMIFGKNHPISSILLAATGLCLVVTIMLVTGRAMVFGPYPCAISREDDPVIFWTGVLAASLLILVFAFSAIRIGPGG